MVATVTTHMYGGPVSSFPAPASWTASSSGYDLSSPAGTSSPAPTAWTVCPTVHGPTAPNWTAVSPASRDGVWPPMSTASPHLKPTTGPVHQTTGFSFASMPSDIARETEGRPSGADRPASVISSGSAPVPYSVAVTLPAPFHPASWYPSTPGKVTATSSRQHRVSPYPSSRPTGLSRPGKFPCEVCGKVYGSRHALSGHVGGAHRGEGSESDRTYECKDCGKTFTKSSTLSAHQRVHTGERPYICPICNRGFSQRSSLVPHLRTHSGEKPYTCTFCPRAFADASTLVKHVRTHTNEKPYRCEVCGVSFTQSGNLKRHSKVHAKKEDGQ